jgi:hypothetical protein
MRLFPSWTIPPLKNDVRQCEFNVAKALIDDPPLALKQVSVLEDELRKMDMPTELMELLSDVGCQLGRKALCYPCHGIERVSRFGESPCRHEVED